MTMFNSPCRKRFSICNIRGPRFYKFRMTAVVQTGLNTLLSSRHTCTTQIVDSRREVQIIRSQTKLNPRVIVRFRLGVRLGQGVQLVDKKSYGKLQLVNKPIFCEPLKHCLDSLNFLQSCKVVKKRSILILNLIYAFFHFASQYTAMYERQ